MARARAEGDLSPLKGLRFCRTPLPRSFPLSFSLPDNALLVFRACSPSLLFSFFHASSAPSLVEASARLEDEFLASNKLRELAHPVSEHVVFCQVDATQPNMLNSLANSYFHASQFYPFLSLLSSSFPFLPLFPSFCHLLHFEEICILARILATRRARAARD